MIVTAIIIGPDLRHVLTSRVEEDIRREGTEDVLEQGPSETEARPVMSVFHNVEAVAVEVRLAIDVHVTKCLQGDLISASPFFLA